MFQLSGFYFRDLRPPAALGVWGLGFNDKPQTGSIVSAALHPQPSVLLHSKAGLGFRVYKESPLKKHVRIQNKGPFIMLRYSPFLSSGLLESRLKPLALQP